MSLGLQDMPGLPDEPFRAEAGWCARCDEGRGWDRLALNKKRHRVRVAVN